MKNKIFYIVLVVVIVIGAVYSYKQLDFGGKTTIFFKIAFGDENTMMRGPSKKPPPNEMNDPIPAEGGREGDAIEGRRGSQGKPKAKTRPGKPGMGKVISLRNVIPYTFILAFFILITRVLDVSIRKTLKAKSSP